MAYVRTTVKATVYDTSGSKKIPVSPSQERKMMDKIPQDDLKVKGSTGLSLRELENRRKCSLKSLLSDDSHYNNVNGHTSSVTSDVPSIVSDYTENQENLIYVERWRNNILKRSGCNVNQPRLTLPYYPSLRVNLYQPYQPEPSREFLKKKQYHTRRSQSATCSSGATIETKSTKSPEIIIQDKEPCYIWSTITVTAKGIDYQLLKPLIQDAFQKLVPRATAVFISTDSSSMWEFELKITFNSTKDRFEAYKILQDEAQVGCAGVVLPHVVNGLMERSEAFATTGSRLTFKLTITPLPSRTDNLSVGTLLHDVSASSHTRHVTNSYMHADPLLHPALQRSLSPQNTMPTTETLSIPRREFETPSVQTRDVGDAEKINYFVPSHVIKQKTQRDSISPRRDSISPTRYYPQDDTKQNIRLDSISPTRHYPQDDKVYIPSLHINRDVPIESPARNPQEDKILPGATREAPSPRLNDRESPIASTEPRSNESRCTRTMTPQNITPLNTTPLFLRHNSSKITPPPMPPLTMNLTTDFRFQVEEQAPIRMPMTARSSLPARLQSDEGASITTRSLLSQGGRFQNNRWSISNDDTTLSRWKQRSLLGKEESEGMGSTVPSHSSFHPILRRSVTGHHLRHSNTGFSIGQPERPIAQYAYRESF